MVLQKFLNFGKTAASRLKSLAHEAETESEVGTHKIRLGEIHT